MQRIPTIEVSAHPGERVHVAGWLHSLRRLGAVNFLIIRDGWGTVQAIAENEAELEPLLTVEAGIETVLAVEGLVVSNPQAPGGFELHELSIEIVTPVTATLPVAINKRTLKAQSGTILDHAMVTNRHRSEERRVG